MPEEVSGNTIGNLNAGGRLAASDELLLVSGWGYDEKSYNKKGLYLVDPEKKLVRKIVDDSCSCINKVGKWIFYITYEELKQKLYRICIDGTGRERLCDDEVNQVCVVDEWIYYINNELYNDGWRKLYRISTNGVFKEKLCDKQLYKFHVKDGWIYFASSNDGFFNDDDVSLYRMHTNGNSLQKIDITEITSYFTIDGDWIYCHLNRNNTSGVEKGLVLMQLDGNKKQYIPLHQNVERYHICDGWIYYGNKIDKDKPHKTKLYRMRINGENNQSLNCKKKLSGIVSGIHIIGEWVYHSCEMYEDLIRVRKNGDCYQILYGYDDSDYCINIDNFEHSATLGMATDKYQPKSLPKTLIELPKSQPVEIPKPPKRKDKIVFSENIKTLDEARELLVRHNSEKAIFGEDILDMVTTLDAYKHHSEVAAEVIVKLFPPPQMAYDKFMGELMDSDATFLRLMCKGADIVGIAVKRTAKRNEILTKIKEDARSLAELCDDLATVLINKYGDNSISDDPAKEVDSLLSDLQILIESVKNYS